MNYSRAVLLVARVSVASQWRRRTTTVLLLLLPIVLFAAMRTSGRSLGVAALGVGLAWSISALGAFGVRSNAGLDSRLALTGLQPSRIFVGRLLGFAAISFLICGVLAVLVPLVDEQLPRHVLFLGLLMAAAVALGVGMLVGLLMPGELESVLVIIGLFGVPLGLALDSAVLKFAPGYGSIVYLQYLGQDTDARYFLHAAGVTVVTLAVAYAWWRRSTRSAKALR